MGVLSTLRDFFGVKPKEQPTERALNEKHTINNISSFTRKASAKNNSKASAEQNAASSLAKSSVTSPSVSIKQQTSSSGHSYKFRDGRRYHADESVAYVLPNDDDEADRVHQQHWILRHALDGNFSVPLHKQLEEGIIVLDSGTGPATWSFEMGETYPRSTIFGIDASCTFPEEIKPANVEFVIGNVAKELPYEDNFFDYIHQRLLILGLTGEDWPKTLNNFYKVLKPGGYIELSEPDLHEMDEAGPCMEELRTTLSNMSLARGLPPKIASELEGRLLSAGFVDVVVRITRIPLNHTSKVGELLWNDFVHGFSNLGPVMSKTNPAFLDPEAYKAHLVECGEEVKRNKSCIIWYNVYARKPQPETVNQSTEL